MCDAAHLLVNDGLVEEAEAFLGKKLEILQDDIEYSLGYITEINFDVTESPEEYVRGYLEVVVDYLKVTNILLLAT